MASSLLPRLAASAARRPRLAAIPLGALSALALPPIHAIPLLFVVVPALLLLIGRSRGPWAAAGIGYWFGFGHHVVGLYWMTEAILVRADEFWWLVPFAVPGLSLVLGPFIAAPCAIARLAPAGLPRAMALAGAWVLADLARQFTATGFPWNLLGSVWEMPGRLGDIAIQPAAFIGFHGLTLLTLLLAATPLLGRKAVAGAAAALAIWLGFGVWRLGQPVLPVADLSVVLVQGNISLDQKMDRALARQSFEKYLQLTSDATARLNGGPGVVIWPETASLFPLDIDAGARAAIVAASHGLPGLIGTLRFGTDHRPRNSMTAIVSADAPVAVFDKFHLVPFGEYQPGWLPLPVQIVPGGGFVMGPGPRTLHVPGLPPVGALICYEVIFPAGVVDPAERPAWLANITNDAWFGNSTGPRQHLAAARARAVEEGLPLMRAANTGITAGFDAFGHELGRIGMNVSGALTLKLPGALPPTVSSRCGLWVPGSLGALSLALALACRLWRRRSAFNRHR